ncbi:MAG: polysaccharide pyruvyl transferase family protein [Acetobacter sp.]|jgi:hypothetical protein
MRQISIVDTSISTNNIGDDIIMDSVNKFIYNNFPDAYVWRVASHEVLTSLGKSRISGSDFCFLGGTNLLSSNLNINGLWRIDEKDCEIFARTNTICLGVGWNDYMSDPNEKTKNMMSKIFNGKYLNSTRDNYTKNKLNVAGVEAVFTSCPTTWSLNRSHCKSIPTKKSDSVVFTLTEWRKNPDIDLKMIRYLKKHYRKIYFFPQMLADLEYFYSFNEGDVKIISPTLHGYDTFLDNEDIDFVGTRLHGGIRALQKKKRTLIISIDNRSIEMGKDTNLPMLERNKIDSSISEWIEGENKTEIDIPYMNLSTFMNQFQCVENKNFFFNIEDITSHSRKHPSP